MAGEELGITSANVKSLAGAIINKEMNSSLGKDPLQGVSKLGLSADWPCYHWPSREFAKKFSKEILV